MENVYYSRTDENLFWIVTEDQTNNTENHHKFYDAFKIPVTKDCNCSEVSLSNERWPGAKVYFTVHPYFGDAAITIDESMDDFIKF